MAGATAAAGGLGSDRRSARAGRWADGGHGRRISGWSLAVQAVHVGNQHHLTTAHPDRESSVIGAYTAFYSLGSALGAVTSAWAYTAWGWWASCLAGASYALLALLVWARARDLSGAAARRWGVQGPRRP